MEVGNEFDCMFSLKFATFGLLKIILFAADRPSKESAKFHFLTIHIFCFELSVWKWKSGAEEDMKS
jgi:hypothetical protein